MPDETLSLEKMVEFWKTLPRVPKLFLGPDSDFSVCMAIGPWELWRDIPTDKYLPKNTLAVLDEEKREMTFFDLAKRTGFTMNMDLHPSPYDGQPWPADWGKPPKGHGMNVDYARLDSRPDVEGILKLYRRSEYQEQKDSIANLCRYALRLERKLERIAES